MSEYASAESIEAYVSRLKAELAFLGATEADDLVAEVRSLLAEAAACDPERLESKIARFGEPAELAAAILAEKGLSPAQGMSTAEWWRMGIAVPLDIAIGLVVPAAMAFPAYWIATVAEPRSWAVLLAIAVCTTAIAWAWWVWRPWRTGGLRRTAGMTLTGLSVVRAPGFRKVVRSRDLAALGMRPPAGGSTLGLVALLVAILMLGMLGAQALLALGDPLPATVVERTGAVFSAAAGPQAEQRRQVVQVLDQMYGSLATFGVDALDGRQVVGQTVWAYDIIVRRTQEEKLVSYEIAEPRRVSIGAWKAAVTEKTATATRRVDYTLVLRLDLRPADTAGGFDHTADWVIYEITGDGIVPEQ